MERSRLRTELSLACSPAARCVRRFRKAWRTDSLAQGFPFKLPAQLVVVLIALNDSVGAVRRRAELGLYETQLHVKSYYVHLPGRQRTRIRTGEAESFRAPRRG